MKNCSDVLSRVMLHCRSSEWRLPVVILLLAVAGTVIPRHIGFSLTPSLAHRVFWIRWNPAHVGRGNYVYFEDAELARKVGKPGRPHIFKVIGCDEGDTLNVEGKRFFCNGEYLGEAKDYSLKGEKMEIFEFNGTIPRGSLFVMGEHRDSYDSRYFGFVERSRVKARLYPLL